MSNLYVVKNVNSGPKQLDTLTLLNNSVLKMGYIQLNAYTTKTTRWINYSFPEKQHYVKVRSLAVNSKSRYGHARIYADGALIGSIGNYGAWDGVVTIVDKVMPHADIQ